MTCAAMTSEDASRSPMAPAPATGPGSLRGRPSQGVALCTAMLKAALLGSHLALLLAVVVSLVFGHGVGAANAAVAAALVIVFFASGQAVQLLAAERGDAGGLGMVIVSYCLRVVVLGMVLRLASLNQDRLESVFDPHCFLLGAVLATLGWLAGVLVANARARVFIYDADHDAWYGGGVRHDHDRQH